MEFSAFRPQFAESYDVAAVQIGRAVVVYGLAALLLSLQFLKTQQRCGVGGVVLMVSLLAALREVAQATQFAGIADVTGPIMALMAVGMLFITVWVMRYAVRLSTSRHGEQVKPVK